MNNEIFLRRKKKMFINLGDEKQPNIPHIATIIQNIRRLDFTLSKQLINILKTKSVYELEDFYLETIFILKKIIGANVKYEPMYPNFPIQVMEAPKSELYVNSILHYLSEGMLKSAFEKDVRLPFSENNAFFVIDFGNKSEFINIFTDLISSKTSISNSDKLDLIWFLSHYDYRKYLPKNIPYKENMAIIFAIILKNNLNMDFNFIKRYFHTPTDILRLCTAMSEGDISLAYNTKFKKFKRAERYLILMLLENCNFIEEDMIRHKERWIRLGEILHPGEYIEFEKVRNAFEIIRNNGLVKTYNGALEKNIKNKDIKNTVKLLKDKPGVFARKLDYLLRTSDYKNYIIENFEYVAHKVSVPVLLQLREHFLRRNYISDRIFLPRGNVAKVYCKEEKVPHIEEKYCKIICNICENTLIENFKKRQYLGKVYLDKKFKNYLIPFSQLSANCSIKSITRGSRIPIDSRANFIRTFIWWKNAMGRVDLDISASIFNENWSYLEHVSYTNLRSKTYNIVHSGDFVDSPEGASEFIDIDLNSATKFGARYAVISVFSFTLQSFFKLPKSYFAFMTREKQEFGEIYEPRTVNNRINLFSKTCISIPIIIDLKEREIIWADLGVTRDPRLENNIESNQKGIILSCKSIVNMIKPNLYDLVDLHIKARGHRCKDKYNANTIFDIDDGITPFDTEIFMNHYL